MGTTTFSGPVLVGPKKDPTGATPDTQGTVQLVQTGVLTFANTTATKLSINLPKGAQIFAVNLSGTLTGTTPTVSVGTTSANANELVNAQAFATGTSVYVSSPTTPGSYLTGGFALLTADTILWGKIGGTGLSAGTVTVVVEYIQGANTAMF